MPSILTSKQEISDVILYEQFKEYGHCRTKALVLRTAAFEIGQVVKNDGDGTYSGVVIADVGALNADVAIVIDDAVYDGNTGDISTAILQMPAGGVAGAKIGGLKYLDGLSAANKLVVQAALAAKGIKSFTTV